MNFPVLPENLASLDADELSALRAEFRTATSAIVANGKTNVLSDEDLANARAGKVAIEAIDAELANRQALADELEAIESALEDEPEADETDDETDPDLDEADDSEDAEDEDEVDEADAETDDDASVTAGAPARRPTAAGAAKAKPKSSRPKSLDEQAQRWTAAAAVPGFSVGDTFESMEDIGKALMKRYKDIQGGGTERLGVAKIEARHLGDSPEGEFISFGDPEEALVAGLDCVPREPIYDVGCDSSTARPFANSLPNRQAPRGGFSVYPSPKLADVTDGSAPGDGTGIWTRDDDAVDSDSVKAACAVIPCGTPDDYDIYGVYRCITIRNLHQMTHPELVAAYLNKLGALWARLAERTLLEAALDSPNVVDLTATAEDDLGASVNLLDKLVQTAAVYTEQERYDDGLTFGVWLHRWVATLLIRDWMRAPRYNPSISDLVAARSEVNAAFAKAGFNVHWVMDDPSGWGAIGTQTAGALEDLPTTADMLIAREGNFARLDEGSMTVGVTNRGTPWDKDDMARNQFTMFWESYEGIIDYGCPSYTLSVDGLCPKGLVNYAAEAAPACPEGS